LHKFRCVYVFNIVREKSPKPPGKKEDDTVSDQIFIYSADHRVFRILVINEIFRYCNDWSRHCRLL